MRDATPTDPEPSEAAGAAPAQLSRGQLYLFAAASAVVTANAYYIHPIIARVAEDFHVGPATVGAAPALNQIALAFGIFLLLPLGDWISNRRLVAVFTAGQCASIFAMAFAPDFRLFVAGSTVLGFFTIAPYLLPAYVSKRVAPERLGEATAVLTTGIIAGILLARAGAGLVGEHFGWRTVYLVAGTLLLAATLLLPLVMDERERDPEGGRGARRYAALLVSLAPLVRQRPEIILSGAVQALSFGVFLAIWLGLGLHLTSDAMGYGVDTVGYLAAFSILNLATTPRLGALADRIGPRRARVGLAGAQLFGVALFLPFGGDLWLLVIPIVITNLAGPVIDVTNRMTFLSAAPEIRTRLMTVYIVMMFTGGGAASWAGTAAYDYAGWTGCALLALAMSCAVFALSLAACLWKGSGAGPAARSEA